MSTPRLPDDNLERDRAEIARAYRDACTAPEGPPAAVDAAIRAAARRQVKAGPRARWVMPAWTRPLTAAAVVVLTLSVVFVAIDNDPSLKPAPMKAPATADGTAAESSQLPPAPLKTVVTPAKPAASESASVDRLTDKATYAMSEMSAKSKRAISQPEAETTFSGQVREAPASRPEEQATSNALVASPGAVAPPVYAPPRAIALGERGMADATAEKKVRQAEPVVARADAPAPAASVAATPAAPPAVKPAVAKEGLTEAVRQQKIEMAATGKPDGDAIAALRAQQATKDNVHEAQSRPAPASAAPPPAAPPALAKSAAADATQSEARESPAAWIKRILQLKKNGDDKAVASELEKFHKAHPDFALPEELRLAR
ncbi:MAG TPA: hypothetical protein VFV17_10835 [Usitatibacteraceae bacterium]|nr:hypothetical protein [Usitatibacteraceae bacterium]